jgi:DNA-binding protein HU-beta
VHNAHRSAAAPENIGRRAQKTVDPAGFFRFEYLTHNLAPDNRADPREGTMKKSDLIDALAGTTGQSKASVEAVLDALPGAVMSGLSAGDAVTLPGIAKIDAKARAERTVRNPATGASMVSPATTVASIKPVKPFKDAVAKLNR